VPTGRGHSDAPDGDAGDDDIGTATLAGTFRGAAEDFRGRRVEREEVIEGWRTAGAPGGSVPDGR
jgi:hypothetical protein